MENSWGKCEKKKLIKTKKVNHRAKRDSYGAECKRRCDDDDDDFRETKRPNSKNCARLAPQQQPQYDATIVSSCILAATLAHMHPPHSTSTSRTTSQTSIYLFVGAFFFLSSILLCAKRNETNKFGTLHKTTFSYGFAKTLNVDDPFIHSLGISSARLFMHVRCGHFPGSSLLAELHVRSCSIFNENLDD